MCFRLPVGLSCSQHVAKEKRFDWHRPRSFFTSGFRCIHSRSDLSLANRILLAKGNRRCSTRIENRFALSFYEAQCMHCNERQCCEIDGAATVIQPNERHLPLLLTRSQGDDGFVPGRTEGVLEEERVPPPRRQPGTAPPRVLADQDRAAPAGPRRQSEDHARRRFVGYGGDMLLVQDMSNLRDI